MAVLPPGTSGRLAARRVRGWIFTAIRDDQGPSWGPRSLPKRRRLLTLVNLSPCWKPASTFCSYAMPLPCHCHRDQKTTAWLIRAQLLLHRGLWDGVSACFRTSPMAPVLWPDVKAQFQRVNALLLAPRCSSFVSFPPPADRASCNPAADKRPHIPSNGGAQWLSRALSRRLPCLALPCSCSAQLRDTSVDLPATA
jgi:hypothetical protein